MTTTKAVVKLNMVEDVQSFVNDMSSFTDDIDLISGRYIINAKSIMGIFSLDLSEPINVEMYSDNINEIRRFDSIVEKYR